MASSSTVENGLSRAGELNDRTLSPVTSTTGIVASSGSRATARESSQPSMRGIRTSVSTTQGIFPPCSSVERIDPVARHGHHVAGLLERLGIERTDPVVIVNDEHRMPPCHLAPSRSCPCCQQTPCRVGQGPMVRCRHPYLTRLESCPRTGRVAY